MFLLFYSLYQAMFYGEWVMKTSAQLKTEISAPINYIVKFITSIFSDNSYDTFGTDMYQYGNGWFYTVAFVLALITSIGIVVLAVKGIKRIFAVFFTFGR